MMLLVKIVIGVLLLILGRKLFWLLVGGAGFLAGTYLSTLLLPNASEWVSLIFALIVGGLGVLLVMLVQKIGISIAGFIIGGMALSGIASNLFLDVPGWIFFVIGGIIGIVLTFAIFEWSLILISATAGAWMISEAFTLDSMVKLGLFLGLLLIGIIIQFRMKKSEN
ncbi:MAG: DUF4203 domain-containing protein [Anaerolineaceae bacterium]|nr:DUF4203 domain-containing protein [Anaerolineaceae bacterium]